MAGAGQPFYMPLTWPVGHVLSAVSKPENEKVSSPAAMPALDMIGHATSMIAATRSFLMAYLCMFVLYSGSDYPAFGRAKTYELEWIVPIIARDLIATWLIAGMWDWFLYFSPLREKLHKYKLNPNYPGFAQMKHDAIASTIASLCGACIEVVLCHYWATGALVGAIDPESGSALPLFGGESTHKTWLTIVWAITITHWRVPHFYFVHRVMHPWKCANFPDLGKYLYNWVHKQHHKSHNPTAFSGTNMHVVEATLYYSAALIPVAFGQHPCIAVGCIIDCAVGAWLGHDGFQWPGSGDYFHQLHHKHFDCNYGAMHFPMDKWFGTFADSSKAVSKIWAASNAASKKSSPKSKSKSKSVDQVTPRARSSASPRRSARLAAK